MGLCASFCSCMSTIQDASSTIQKQLDREYSGRAQITWYTILYGRLLSLLLTMNAMSNPAYPAHLTYLHLNLQNFNSWHLMKVKTQCEQLASL